MIYRFPFRFAACLVIFLLPCVESAAQEIEAKALNAHTYYLSHDLLEGRGTASRGESLAALYLSSRMRELGLQPLAKDYRLPVPLTAYSFDSTRASMRILTGQNEHTLRHPDFYHPGGAPSSFRDFSGELLWAGPTPGALSALRDHRDLSGTVVVLTAPWTGIGEVEAELLRRGAAGAIEIVPNDFYERLRVVRGPTRYALPREVDDPDNQSPLPVVVTGPAGADALGVIPWLDSGDTLRSARPMDARAEINLASSSEKTTAYNVAAMLPGTDPDRSDRAMIYLAHYDHVGFGQPAGADSIWNGFTDNASGTAALLEIARVLHEDPPPYSVLFLFTTAEEQGLLGATWFLHRPPLSLDRIDLAINIDGGIPPADISQWTLAAPPGQEWIAGAVGEMADDGWTLQRRPLTSDSDHWPFHRADIPAFFLYPGSQADSRFIHTAEDEWRKDFPFAGLVRYAEAARQLGRILMEGK